MPWPTKKLGELVDFLDNQRKPINDEDRQKRIGPYPYYGANGQVGWIDDFIFDEDLVLLAEDGGYFGSKDRPIAYRISGKTWVNNHAHVLRVKRDIAETGFIHYRLMFYDIKPYITGSTRAKLNKSAAEKIKIPLPPLAIQKQIVERLDKIAEAQKLNDTLIQKSEELFQSFFYNEYEVKTNQWNSKKLQEVCEKVDQIHPKKMFKKKFSYIDIASINNDKVIRAQIVLVDKAPSRARKVVKTGDTIFSTVRPYLKHIAYIPEMLDNSIASTGFCVIRPDADLVNTLFLNYVVESDHFVRKVLPFQRGANYPAVSDKNVYDIKIALPPIETQKQIVAKLSAVQDYKKQLLEQKSKLKELFDSSLSKSMASEKKSKDT